MDLLPADLPLSIAVSLVALSFVTSLISVAAGLGGGVIIIAVFAQVLPAAAVIPLHGITQLGSTAGRAFMWRAHVDGALVGWFGIGAAFGAWLGASVLVALPTAILQLVLGLFILYSVWGPTQRRHRITGKGFLPFGIVSSFISMFVGATGPFVATFLSPDRFGKDSTIALIASFMSVQHTLKVVMFALFGFAFGPWLMLIGAMMVSGVCGTWFGRKVLLNVQEKRFKLIFNTVLTLLALRLLWTAVNAMR